MVLVGISTSAIVEFRWRRKGFVRSFKNMVIERWIDIGFRQLVEFNYLEIRRVGPIWFFVDDSGAIGKVVSSLLCSFGFRLSLLQ
jgi:hypothetical protein